MRSETRAGKGRDRGSDPKGPAMQRKATQSAADIERERIRRAQYARLTAHYGQIGPAALNAALLHAKCRKGNAHEQDAGRCTPASG